VDQVRLLGAHPIIITGGFSVLAGQIARRLGVKYYSSNRFIVENGVIEGVRTPILDENEKKLKLKALASWLGIPIQRCVAIGDGANDGPMLKEAGLGIDFGNRECVKCTDEVVTSGDLRDIIPLIMDHLASTRTHSLSHPTTVTIP
jgi:phosphoserine phosphatase